MPQRRHYPPLVVLHSTDCPALVRLPRQVETLPIDEARTKYHTHSFDQCIATNLTPSVVVEAAVPDHPYDPSGQQPEDAIRSLCNKCFGTHGEDENREVITVDALPTPVHEGPVEMRRQLQGPNLRYAPGSWGPV